MMLTKHIIWEKKVFPGVMIEKNFYIVEIKKLLFVKCSVAPTNMKLKVYSIWISPCLLLSSVCYRWYTETITAMLLLSKHFGKLRLMKLLTKVH